MTVVEEQGIAENPVVNFLRTRRSVPAKTMRGPGPSRQQIEEMITIASRVPDHKKLAPWRFVYYSPNYCLQLGAKLVLRLAEKDGGLSAEQVEAERSRFTRAGAVIAVISAPKKDPAIPVWEQQLSAGAAAMNLLNAANAYGFDAQWLTEWYAYDEALREDFGLIAKNEKLVGFIHIGHRTAPKTERSRPQLETIFTVMGG